MILFFFGLIKFLIGYLPFLYGYRVVYGLIPLVLYMLTPQYNRVILVEWFALGIYASIAFDVRHISRGTLIDLFGLGIRYY